MARLDPVTVTLYLHGRLCVAYAVVGGVFELAPRPGFRWSHAKVICGDGITADVTDPTDCFFDDEGTTWVRGHVAGDAALSLLAAASLACETGAVPQHEFNLDYSSSEWRYDFDGYSDDNHPVYEDGSWLAR